MKLLPQAKSNGMSLKEVTTLINQIYGETISTGFDKACIQKYEVLFENGLPISVSVFYDKLKVTHKDKSVGYWPIEPFEEDLQIESGLNIIKELK